MLRGSFDFAVDVSALRWLCVCTAWPKARQRERESEHFVIGMQFLVEVLMVAFGCQVELLTVATRSFSRCASFFSLDMTVQPLIKSYFILQMGNIKKQIVRQLN